MFFKMSEKLRNKTTVKTQDRFIILQCLDKELSVQSICRELNIGKRTVHDSG